MIKGYIYKVEVINGNGNSKYRFPYEVVLGIHLMSS